MDGNEWKGARASLGCPGQSVVLGQIRGARARLGYQCHSRVPERIRDARISPGCQSQSGLPGAVWDARANQVPRQVWGANANLTRMLHQGCYEVTCAIRFAVHCCCIATGAHLYGVKPFVSYFWFFTGDAHIKIFEKN